MSRKRTGLYFDSRWARIVLLALFGAFLYPAAAAVAAESTSPRPVQPGSKTANATQTQSPPQTQKAPNPSDVLIQLKSFQGAMEQFNENACKYLDAESSKTCQLEIQQFSEFDEELTEVISASGSTKLSSSVVEKLYNYLDSLRVRYYLFFGGSNNCGYFDNRCAPIDPEIKEYILQSSLKWKTFAWAMQNNLANAASSKINSKEADDFQKAFAFIKGYCKVLTIADKNLCQNVEALQSELLLAEATMSRIGRDKNIFNSTSLVGNIADCFALVSDKNVLDRSSILKSLEKISERKSSAGNCQSGQRSNVQIHLDKLSRIMFANKMRDDANTLNDWPEEKNETSNVPSTFESHVGFAKHLIQMMAYKSGPQFQTKAQTKRSSKSFIKLLNKPPTDTPFLKYFKDRPTFIADIETSCKTQTSKLCKLSQLKDFLWDTQNMLPLLRDLNEKGKLPYLEGEILRKSYERATDCFSALTDPPKKGASTYENTMQSALANLEALLESKGQSQKCWIDEESAAQMRKRMGIDDFYRTLKILSFEVPKSAFVVYTDTSSKNLDMKSPDMKSVDVENVNILIGKLVSLLDSIQKTIAITKDPNLKKWLVFFDQKMLRQISFRVSAKNLTPEKLFESENAAACLNISRLKIQTALLSGNPNKYFDDVPQARRHFENISISWVFLKYSLNFVPGNDCEVEKEVYERFRLSF